VQSRVTDNLAAFFKIVTFRRDYRDPSQLSARTI
jgi:hypothetical protein